MSTVPAKYADDDRSTCAHSRAMTIQTLLAFYGRTLENIKRFEAMGNDELSRAYAAMMD